MYKVLNTTELIALIKAYKFTRKVSEFHIHHTWKPDHKDFNGSNGLQLQQNMRNYHVNNLGWSDIGQHLTLLPDGNWVIGRDFNLIPASIYGRNSFAFAIEMLGNFDKGHDELEGKQLASILDLLYFGLDFFNLPESAIIFHREYAPKTCPGSNIDKQKFIEQVKDRGNKKVDINTVTIVMDNKKLNIDNLIYKESTYVKLRDFVNILGKNIKWDEVTRTIYISGGK